MVALEILGLIAAFYVALGLMLQIIIHANRRKARKFR